MAKILWGRLYERADGSYRAVRIGGLATADASWGHRVTEIWVEDAALTPSPTPTAPQEADALRELIAAAQSVIERWDTPTWKAAPHTAIFINRMRDAIDTLLAQHQPQQGEQHG